MEVKKICPILAPTINRLVDMQKTLVISQMIGDYDCYKIASKQYASYGVKHFGLLKHINFPEIKIPVFSREGFNLIKIMVRDCFRKKTPDEKQFRRLIKELRIERKYKLNKAV